MKGETMRTISKIIELVANGEKPDYDELRLTVQCLQLRLIRAVTDLIVYGNELIRKTWFTGNKQFMNTSPDVWLGDNWHPDSEAYKKRRKMSFEIAKKAIPEIFDNEKRGRK